MNVELTLVGLTVIGIVTPFLLMRHRLQTILKFAIFFLPFGSLAVINVHSAPTFGIGLDQFFALFLIFSVFLFSIFRKYNGPRLPAILTWVFFYFLSAIVISWIVTVNSEGMTVWTFSENSFYQIPLKFSHANITKTVYLFVSVFFFASLYKTLKLLDPLQISRIFIASCFIIAISALMDFIPGISSLWVLLKNNISYSNAIGLDYWKYPRVSGLIREAGALAEFLLFGLSIAVAFYMEDLKIFNRKVDFAILLIFVTAALLTFSSTVIAGFLLIATYVSVKLFSKRPLKLHIIKKSIFLATAVGVLTISLNYLMKANILKLITVTTLAKFGFSEQIGVGTYRTDSIQASLETFMQSPFTILFGTGWGAENLASGVPFLLLSNVGIYGTVIFSFLIISFLITGKRKLEKSDNARERALREGFLLGFLIFITIASITRGMISFHYLPGWFLAAGLISSYGADRVRLTDARRKEDVNVS
jgi:hypothetical protein